MGDDDSDNDGIELVLNGKGRYALLQQHPRVRKVAKDAIFLMEVDACFKNAFPDGPEKYNTFARRTLVKCAESYGDDELVRRLKSDARYAHNLATIVS